MFLSFRTDRSGQTVQTQIRLLLEEIVNSLILPEYKYIWDFMPVKVICKFHKVSIKTIKAGYTLDKVEHGFFLH